MRARTITIFGSAGIRPGEPNYEEACELGRKLAFEGYTVCNGGYQGAMEASARGAQESGGHTVGVIISSWDRTPNRWIRETVVAHTLPERLRILVERGDGFVVLEGGTGTLLELAMVLELMNKREMPVKPILTIGEHWLPVLATVSHERTGDARRLVTHVRTVEECVASLASFFARS